MVQVFDSFFYTLRSLHIKLKTLMELDMLIVFLHLPLLLIWSSVVGLTLLYFFLFFAFSAYLLELRSKKTLINMHLAGK